MPLVFCDLLAEPGDFVSDGVHGLGGYELLMEVQIAEDADADGVLRGDVVESVDIRQKCIRLEEYDCVEDGRRVGAHGWVG